MQACREIGHCATGEAVVTQPGRLKVRSIIHTVGPVWKDGHQGEPELLRAAYTNSFRLAKQQGLKTIAFPAISTGVYGYPKKEAARIALSVGWEWEKDFDEIRYICFSDEDFAVYQDAQNLKSGSGTKR